MNQYRNLPMDLADASLVILAEHMGTGVSSPSINETSTLIDGKILIPFKTS